ncbi:BCS1 N terminal-domain-containing protein [Coniochaeta sp. 2T2.1]|nr:BCS1 N terminal-domain-containing protein [Coniochaeta sp. 2T2.1]
MFIPGFSVFSDAVSRYLHVDLNLYIPLVLVASGAIFCWKYFSEVFWDYVSSYAMSSVDIRTDDELYNYMMAWVANQNFSRDSRRSIANTNVNSRSWFLFRWDRDDDEDEDGTTGGKKKKDLAYTPTFGSHYFWYRGRLLIFRRNQNRDQATFMTVSEREEVSLSCFGRNPWILKELLNEAREVYVKKDESKTLIYRGTTKGGSTEPTWQRCMARTSRPFSTVILNEKVKKDLIDDVTDYLNPATRRWYSNRGIPYRRGYLLYGPPGTGKSSLSLALAGFFKMRIYIVSLSSVTANEENLSSLFAELPRRCVVLLEDIDTAGLTHTREGMEGGTDDEAGGGVAEDQPKKKKKAGSTVAPGGVNNNAFGRLSLSGLLNILDGVASQEGRVLIMTTNHIEKLDKALIRPGRVDMIVKFDRSDRDMTAAIFRAIYAPLEGDDVAPTSVAVNVKESKPFLSLAWKSSASAAAEQAEKEKKVAETKKKEDDEQRKKGEDIAKVERLAELFADRIPAHEFSPAEIQGYLLKNKRDPDAAVEGAESWVVETRKEKKEKELKEAEEKRKKEEEEAKKKEEEEKEKEKKKAKKTKKSRGKGKKEDKDEESDKSGSESGESSEESDSEDEAAKSKSKKSKASVKVEKPAEEKSSEEIAASKEETGIEEPVKEKESSSAPGSEDKLLAEEKKHGGDSGYGTP